MRTAMIGKRLCRMAPALVAAALFAGPVHADVWLYGNGGTLDVLIYGNSPDADQRMAERAFAITRENWHLLWQGDSDQRGWIAVSCVRRTDGGVHFEFATEQPSQSVAQDFARRAAEQFIARQGGTLIAGCGGSVANQGQVLAEVIPHVPPKP